MSVGGPTLRSRLVARGVGNAIVVDGDVIVVHARQVHRLNPTAARVWEGCDGTVELGALGRRLAAEHGADPTVVETDVLRVAGALRDAGLVAPAGDEPVTVPVIEPAAACSGCGPGPRFDRHVLVAVDDGLLGIGTDAAFAAALTDALRARVAGVLDAPDDRASYGVVLPAVEAGAVQEVARLHRGPDVLARSRRPATVVRALLTQIAAHVRDERYAVLEAVAVGGPDGVVLVPGGRRTVAFERAASDAGLAVAGAGLVLLERNAGAVVVGADRLGADVDTLVAAVATRAHPGIAPRELAWGTYRLRGLATTAPGAGRAFGELGPSAPFGRDSDALDAVVAAVAAVPWVASTPEAIAGALTARD